LYSSSSLPLSTCEQLPRYSLPAAPAVLLAIVSMEGGAAVAKGLFPVLGAAGTVSLRIGFSALLMLVVVRPPLRSLHATAPA
jgi:inner membrane transporter RhtA